jgi:NNP family nitrate/nitrite transporter-like MFS transporter
MKATKISLLDFKSVPMRTFHLTWITFFICFFGWFGIAPLMPVVREDLNLTKGQIGNIIIASVAITIFARLFFGWLCDRIGPRISYTILLLVGSLPVMFIGLSNSYETFLLFRLAIGVIGASFVITQYHTSVMFAPNVVGTANATAAGWGNMGGGVTLMVMPLVFAAFVGVGYVNEQAWRYSMVLPGIALFVMGLVYYFYTQDTADGNFKETRKNNLASKSANSKGNFLSVRCLLRH